MSFNEKLSYTEHVVVSPTTDFTIGFVDYGLPSDTINVFVDDVLATEAGYTVTRKNNMVVELQPAVASGVVRLQRVTNLDTSFYSFTAGAKFVAANIDANFNQILHSQQETRDGFDKLAGDVYPLVDGLEVALSKADEASKAAQEAADAAEEAAQVTRSASQVKDANGLNQQEINNLTKEATFSFLTFGAKGDGVTDDSISIGLASTWSSTYKRKVSGLGKEYKCSNVLFDSNCYLADAKLINNANADLISVLTTAVSREWLENVTFENIHINGKRIDQTGVKDSGLGEDGGRHGFRFRRPCRNIRIRKSSANYCASDGICIFPDMFNGGDVVSIIDFVIEDSEFNWNRRHGGSSDRTNGLTLINTKCNFNGRYLDGYENAAANSGAQGDKPYLKNYYYGNGWDSEEYDNHTYSSNLNFINCEMIDNAKGGLLILATAGATAVNENIKIIGGRYNKGVLNTQDNNSISLTPNSVTNTSTVYKDVVIASVTTSDAILLRNVVNYNVTSTPCNLTAVEYSQGYYDQLVALVNGASTSKNIQYLAAPPDKYTYNRQFDVILAKDVKSTYYDSSNAGIVHQWRYLLNGDVKGAIIGNIKPEDNTVSVGYRMDGASEQLRIETTGVTFKNSTSLSPANIGEITITPVSNTKLALKYKGSDGVVRSASLTLA